MTHDFTSPRTCELVKEIHLPPNALHSLDTRRGSHAMAWPSRSSKEIVCSRRSTSSGRTVTLANLSAMALSVSPALRHSRQRQCGAICWPSSQGSWCAQHICLACLLHTCLATSYPEGALSSRASMMLQRLSGPRLPLARTAKGHLLGSLNPCPGSLPLGAVTVGQAGVLVLASPRRAMLIALMVPGNSLGVSITFPSTFPTRPRFRQRLRCASDAQACVNLWNFTCASRPHWAHYAQLRQLQSASHTAATRPENLRVYPGFHVVLWT
jgi:hypothetical protein